MNSQNKMIKSNIILYFLRVFLICW